MKKSEGVGYSLTTLTFLVMANMIGAGCFTTTGFTLKALGSPTAVLFAWLIGGFIATTGAISYGMLVKHLCESGGEYIFLKKYCHPAAGFTAGILSLTVGFSGAAAYAAMTLGVYTNSNLSTNTVSSIASFVVLLCWFIHSIKVKSTTLIQNCIVSLKVIGLISFIGYAIFHSNLTINSLDTSTNFSFYTFASTLMWISFSYSGFNAAIYIAEEAKSPKKNVPRAMIIGTVVTCLLYLAINIVFVYYTPTNLLSGFPDVAVRSASYIGGKYLEQAIRFIIIAAMFTTVSSLFIIGPRVYNKMAEDGFLPKLFLIKKNGLLAANTLQALIILTLIWLTHLRELLSYLSITLSISTLLTVSTLFKLYPNKNLKDFTPPIIFLLLTSLFIVLTFYDRPYESLASAMTIALCIVIYFFWQRRHKIKE